MLTGAGWDSALNTLLTGLQAYSWQQDVLANDVANANTPGFQAETVTFQKTLQGQLAPTLTTAPGLMTANGNGVDLEATLIQLEQAAGRLQGLDSLVGGSLTTVNGIVTDLEGA
jgi:flagellar basal body rod protein FlgB